jgi:hypothetical protein
MPSITRSSLMFSQEVNGSLLRQFLNRNFTNSEIRSTWLQSMLRF